jgi:S1-C subfamily serine protease
MASQPEWKIPFGQQPKAEDYAFDLDTALSSVVAVTSHIPEEAFTAETLGTLRMGNGVVIREDGLILTIGYLITEAEDIWLRANDGRTFQGHVLAYDQETGFGLIQALAHIDLPALPLGSAAESKVGDSVIVGGAGGKEKSIAANIAAKQEFAGYWEYVLDEAIYTVPAHPNWGGTAVINDRGHLIGLGSLHIEESEGAGNRGHLNMIVPIDLLKPILDDLVTIGRRRTPPKPWLGVYASEIEDRIVVVGRSQRGPARKADIRNGDIIVAVAGEPVSSLGSFYRRIKEQGEAGVEIPLTIHREGKTFEVRMQSSDRSRMFKAPKLH